MGTRGWLIVVMVGWTGPVGQGASNRVIEHRQANFGIAAIVDGGDGVLYVGGANGLWRFDGFRYVAEKGYPFRSVTYLAKGSDGVLWAGSVEEGLARRDRGGVFKVVEKGGIRELVTVGQEVYYERWNPIELVQRKGTERRVARVGDSCYLGGRVANELDAVCGGRHIRVDRETMKWREMPGPRGAFLKFRDGEGREWLLDKKKVTAWRDQRQEREIPLESKARWDTLTLGRSGQVWMKDGRRVRGLSPEMEFQELPGVVLGIHEDEQGHVWAGSEKGELWELVVEKGWARWNREDFGGETPSQVLEDGGGLRWVVTEAGFWRKGESGQGWKREPLRPGGEMWFAIPENDRGWLAAVRGKGLVWMRSGGAAGMVVEGSGEERLRNSFRRMVKRDEGGWWLGSKRGLFEMRDGKMKDVPLPGTASWREDPRTSGKALGSVVDFAKDGKGRWWAGYPGGLLFFDEGRWKKWEMEGDLGQVVSLAIRGEDEVWVVEQGKPELVRVRGRKAERIAVGGEYEGEESRYVRIDRRGWVWRGTDRGVQVSNGKCVEREDWLDIKAGNAAVYGFGEDAEGGVWLADDEGVTRVVPREDWFGVEQGKPRLSGVWVGEEQWPEVPRELKRAPARVRLEFGKLGTRVFRREPLQYRVGGKEVPWRVAKNGVVELEAASTGVYRIEVRHLGFRETWVHEMEIGEAWSWWWWSPAAPVAGWCWWKRRERWSYAWKKRLFLWKRRLRSRRRRPGRDRSGEMVGSGYRLKHQISAGGFAQVYRAEREGKTLAVKVIHHRIAEAGWVRERFAQEVAALHLVKHPAVVEILDSWVEATGEPCLAMPLIEGRTLRTELQGGPWEAERAAVLVEELGGALGAVHRAGVVHRDVKPENVLLRPDGSPVLIDFGTSGLLGAGEAGTTTKILAGSWEYLAPERLTGVYSAASDMYGLGAIAFELLSGRKLAESGIGMKRDELLDSVEDWIGSGQREAARLIAMAVDPLPEERPAEAEEWGRQLAEALRRRQQIN